MTNLSKAICATTGNVSMFEQRLIELLQADRMRMESLVAVQQLNLPDCYIAAGFVRNLVWDNLHQSKTPLNDIDVIYFDKNDRNKELAMKAEKQLAQSLPNLNWQVKNQAIMHIRNGDPAYQNSLHAMSFWPEKETAVGARLAQDGDIEIISAFDLKRLFSGSVSHNEKRNKQIFEQRVDAKNWLRIWPNLKVKG
jgi:hypothetical protein